MAEELKLVLPQEEKEEVVEEVKVEEPVQEQELIKIEDDYFINTFTRQPIVLDHGEGVKVTDIDGNEYIDMFYELVNCFGLVFAA